MYCAVDKNYNMYFADNGSWRQTDKELESALYCFSEYGNINDSPITFNDIVEEFERFKEAERSGCYDKGTFTGYKDVYEFIRDSVPEMYTILLPLEESESAIENIMEVYRHSKDPERMTQEEIKTELKKAYNGTIPDWLEYGLSDFIEWIWDVDGGPWQELFP